MSKKVIAIFLYHPSVEYRGRQSVKPHHGKFIDEIATQFSRVYLVAPYWREHQFPSWMLKNGLMYDYVFKNPEVKIVKGFSAKNAYPFRFFQQLYYVLKSDEIFFFTPALAPILFGIFCNLIGKPYYSYVAIDIEQFFSERFRSRGVGKLLGGLLAWVIGRSRGVLATGSANLDRFSKKTKTLRVSPLLAFTPKIENEISHRSEALLKTKETWIFIAPLVPRKNAIVVVEAAKQRAADLAKENGEFFLNLVGNISEDWGDSKAYGERCLKDLEPLIKAGQAKYWGYLKDPEKLQSLLKESNFLLLPSEAEGFPKVVYEAMAVGCVPVLTRLPSYHGFLEENQNALFLRDASASSIIESVSTADVQLVNRIAQNNISFLKKAIQESAAEQFRKMRRLKIAYASTSQIPSLAANSVHVMKVAQALREEGQEVCLYAPREWTKIFSGLGSQGKLKSLQKIWDHYGIRKPFPISWLFTFPIFRLFDYSVLVGLWVKWIRPADLVWTRHYPIGIVFTVLRVPFLLEMHRPLRLDSFLRRNVFKLVVRTSLFQKLVVISDSLKSIYEKDFVRLGLESNLYKIQVSHDGVDLEAFELCDPTPSNALASGQRVKVGYSGHLYAGRGIELLLAVAKRIPEVDFIFLGGRDEDVSKYQKHCEKMAIQNAKFLGFLPNSQLPAYLKTMDILVMPYQRNLSVSGADNAFSNTASWMSPMKMFEYLACGKPIVSSDLPVLKEVLTERNTVFCDPESQEEWVKAIQTLAQDSELRLKMGQAGLDQAKHYTWRSRVRGILSASQIL